MTSKWLPFKNCGPYCIGVCLCLSCSCHHRS